MKPDPGQKALTKPRCSLMLVRVPDSVDVSHAALLSAKEQRACQRLRREAHRARYACAHALLRAALAKTLNVRPSAINLQAGENKRPQLGSDHLALMPGLDFNISSTHGYAACAIAHDVRVGVDLEQAKPGQDSPDLLERVLTRDEKDWLARSKDPSAFFQLWTMKEAVAKADGEGLGLPFNQLQALPRREGDLQLDLRQAGHAAWHWRVLSLNTAVPAALAIAGPETDGDIELNAAVPPMFDAVRVSLRAEGRTRPVSFDS